MAEGLSPESALIQANQLFTPESKFWMHIGEPGWTGLANRANVLAPFRVSMAASAHLEIHDGLLKATRANTDEVYVGPWLTTQTPSHWSCFDVDGRFRVSGRLDNPLVQVAAGESGRIPPGGLVLRVPVALETGDPVLANEEGSIIVVNGNQLVLVA